MFKTKKSFNKIKRIAFFNHSMAMGGIEKLLVSMSQELLNQSYKVYMFVFKGGGDLEQELIQNGVIVINLEKKEGIDFKMIIRIIQGIKKHNIELVHTNNFLSSIYMLLPALFFSNVKFIHTDHSLVRDGKTRRYKVLKLTSYLFDHFIVVSEQLKKTISHTCKINEDRIDVIDNGVNTQKFIPDNEMRKKIRKELNIKNDIFILGTVSRLAPVKNHIMLLKAVKIVVEQGHPLHLVIIGDGPEQNSINKSIIKLGLEKTVHTLGAKEEVVNYLQAFDAYALPSISEGMSISLLEAMSCSLPALVTRTGGNIDLVKNNINGLLVEVDDYEAFANATINLIDDKEKRLKLGHKSRDIVIEQYSLKQMVNNYISIYSS